MTSEAFHASAAGPRDAWPRSIAFLAVHCEIQKLMSADPAYAVWIPVRGFEPGFLQAGQSTHVKWEKSIQHPFYSGWRPLRGGLCGNEEFESSSTEARSVSSIWLEILVHWNLGKNNAGRLADVGHARALPLLPVAVQTSIKCAHSLELPFFRQARAKSALTSLALNRSRL
jgi:hypothetical protein